MPKKLVIEDLKLSVDRPSVDVIRFNCKCPAKSIEKCGCNKYFYIVGDLTTNPPEQYRVSSGLVDLKQARKAAAEWEVKLRREERELAQRHRKAITGAITVEQLFGLYEKAQEEGQDKEEIALKGNSPSVGKIKTLRRLLCGHEDPTKREAHIKKYGEPFLEMFNALPPEKRLIGANQTIAKIALAEHITKYWMAHIFKPTWFGGNGSVHSIRKRKEQLQAVWHHAHKLGELDGMGGGRMCTCPPCSIVIPKKMTKTMQPTPPLELWRYQLSLDTCARYQESLHDRNPEQLRCSNERLRCFLAVMGNCGSRRSDTSLMRRDAFKIDRNGDVTWVYVPLKNGDERNPLKVPFPRWLHAQLMALPKEPQFFHPLYFFCSGPTDDPRSVNGGALLRNAADPWVRAISRVVDLMPEETRTVDDGRNKKKRITPHMYRDTFCVECYVQGMSDRQIADAVFDDEETIKRSYSPYHDRKRVRDSVDSMEEGVRYVQEALAGLSADHLMREAGIAW